MSGDLGWFNDQQKQSVSNSFSPKSADLSPKVSLTQEVIAPPKQFLSVHVVQFLNLIRDPDNHQKLIEMSQKHNIKDISEFTFERVLAPVDIDQNVFATGRLSRTSRKSDKSIDIKSNYGNQLFRHSSAMTSQTQSYSLFGKETYHTMHMNPFQLVILHDNIPALKLFVNSMNTHIKLNIGAPQVNSGALQLSDHSMVQHECWSLFVAIQNKSLAMFKYLWEEIGVVKQVSLLWTFGHLMSVLETMCKQNFIDGVKYILESQATISIYKSMSFEAKICFLKKFLIQIQPRLDEKVNEVLLLKLSDTPFATISLFVMATVTFRQT